MERLDTLDAWRRYGERARSRGASVGFVPTMGALHAGHLALIAAARAQCDVVVVSVFVNPRQFNDAGDLERYPRTPEADRSACEAAGVDALAEPSLGEMWPDYPAPTATTVHVAGLGDVLEGAGRPGHFDGVASVVAKLFALSGPCHAYFGEKDFQQLAVIRRMVRDLAIPVNVVGCPIVRDPDGLALSSRNVRLSPSGREQALGLHRALRAAAGAPAPASVVRAALGEVLAEHDLEVAYAEVVDPATLAPRGDAEGGPARALVAAIVDGVRLLDNGEVSLEPAREACDAAGD
jgi:pantoate--beta-alanine ligase